MAIAQKFEVVEGKVKFMGMVKTKKKRPDPVLDHIMANVGDDQQKQVETAGFVTLRIPSGEDPESQRPIDIGLNGQNYKLYRDVPATVPIEIAEILQNAEKSVSVVPMAKGERIVCQVDPESGTYLPGKGPQPVENRRFNLNIEEIE